MDSFRVKILHFQNLLKSFINSQCKNDSVQKLIQFRFAFGIIQGQFFVSYFDIQDFLVQKSKISLDMLTQQFTKLFYFCHTL